MPAAKTVTNVTSARPIISAAAVVAVRPGLRTAFSRASRPVSLRTRSSSEADDRGQRRDEARRQQRGAEEEQHGAEAEQRRRVAGRLDAAEEADADRHEAADAQEDREPGDEPAPAPRGRDRLVAQRLHRRHARRADGRDDRGEQRDDQPDQERHDDRAGLDDAARVRQVDPERLEERVQQVGDADPGEDAQPGPDQRRSRAPRSAPTSGPAAATRPACAASRTRACAARP